MSTEMNSRSQLKRLCTQDPTRMALEIETLREQLAAAEVDAARYRWLCEHGYNYRGAVQGTPSMSISRGPYIILEPPSCNSFSKIACSKELADKVIDAAIAEQTKKGG